MVRLLAQSHSSLHEPCAVQILLKYPVKKVDDGVRKSIDNLNLANVVETRGDRKEMLYKPKLSN